MRLLKFVFLISFIFFIFINTDIISEEFVSVDSTIIVSSKLNISDTKKWSYDSSYFDVKTIDNKYFEKFKNDKDFDYFRNGGQNIDLYLIIERLISDYIIIPIMRFTANSNTSWIILIVLFLPIVAIALLIIKKKYKTRFEQVSSFNITNSEIDFKTIHQIDFDKLIFNSELSQRYSDAVRYKYLKTLKILFDLNILVYHLSKTNTDYIREIKQTDYNQSFGELSDIFNYINYGMFVVTIDTYTSISAIFTDFLDKVNVIEIS